LADLILSLYEKYYIYETYKNRKIDGLWIKGETLGKGSHGIVKKL